MDGAVRCVTFAPSKFLGSVQGCVDSLSLASTLYIRSSVSASVYSQATAASHTSAGMHLKQRRRPRSVTVISTASACTDHTAL